jgi:transposase
MNATVISLSILLRHTRSVTDGGRDIHPIKWRSKFGGMEVSEARRLKALKAENAKLKKMLAEHMLDIATLKEILGKNF